ncbi:tubulin polyglutamylase TTLL11 isoform X3 [Pseudophryne corroboree]|uniref:tubulin polyglutamylase TTLL11 isoform X3 n=1 Tax=Pseudophryne corroboree TaxID=495146 RepID=UPI003081B72F
MGAGPAVTDSSAMSHTGSRGAAAGGPPGAGGEQGHGVPGLHDRGPRARSALPAQGEDKGLSLGTDYCVAQGTDKGVTQGADKGVTLGTANRVTQGADYWVRQGTDYGVTQGTCNGVTTLGADNGVISQPEMGTDIGVTQVLGLVTGNGIARVPGLGTDNGVTQAPGLVTGNGIARVPGLGTDNGVTQAPGLVTGNGIARVPGLGMDNGVTQAPGLVTGNGIARVPGLGTDNGVTQAPGLVTGNGIARVPGLGTDNGVTQVPGLVTGNGITRVPRLGTDNGVTQAPELVTGKGATLVPQLGTYNRMTGLGTDMWVTQCLGLVTDLRDDNWMTQEMGTNNRVTQVLGMDNRLTQVPGQDTDNEGIQGQRLGTENMVTKGSGQRAPGLVLRPQNGKTQEPRQGDAGLRATSRVRSKRREASGDREGQIGCAGGRSSPFTCPLATTRKSEHRVTAGRGMRSPNKGENNGGQKKVEGRTQRRHVTVDSSKAKSSLEALKISIKQLKWREFPHGRRLPCDIYWHGVSFHESENICSGQVNKFPGMIEMVRKINLSRAVRTMQELYPEEYNFYPQSWILPDEYHLFTAEILGFDILLMKNLKPVLLEVNANPSMKIEHEQELFPGIYENVPSPVDEEVKIAVIRDTLRLVDPARRRNCHTQPHPPDSGQNRKTDLHTGATELAESDGSNSPVSNLSSLCLKQVFPKYSKQFTHLRVAERIAALFIRFLGVKGSMKMGPTGFRTFIRSCKLSSGNFSMASGDILYIDITRRWNSVSLDQRESGVPGMCLQAFIEAFFHLAQRRFKGFPLHEQVQTLVDFCESHLDSGDEKRLLCSRGATEKRTALSSLHKADVYVTSYTPLLHRSHPSCNLTDYKLQHS